MPKFEWAVPTGMALHLRTEDRLCERFHENSKLFPAMAQQQVATQFAYSPLELFIASRGFRQYREAPKTALPAPVPSTVPLRDVLRRRRSVRAVSGRVLFDELATLLQESLGPTAIVSNPENDVTQALRAWPSAGGLYPLDAYVVAARIEGLDPGLYHYNVIDAALERLGSRTCQEILQDAFFWQDWVTGASACVLLTANFERTLTKYGERGYRLVLLDAGHAAQNLLLMAEELDLGACAVAGFCDDSLAADLAIDGTSETVVHTVVLGGRS